MRESPIRAWWVLVRVALCAFLLASPSSPEAKPGARLLELRGHVVLPKALARGPGFRRRWLAQVSLFGATSPFAAQTIVDFGGRFKFSKLAPGAYTVAVFITGHGETRRTIELSESAADARGRVQLELRVEAEPASGGTAPDRARQAGAAVSVRDLAIPEKAREEYRRAWARLGKRDVAGAVAHLEKAVALAPQFIEALNSLGTIAYQSQNYARAEAYFRQALEKSPESYEPLVNLGGVLLTMGRPQEALDYNEKAVEMRPDDALANSQMGMNLFALGKPAEAVPYLEEARDLDPAHFSHPQLLLAEIYLRLADASRAAAELEDFLRQHPDYPEAAKIRAQILKMKDGR